MNDQRSGGEEPASPKGASASMTLAAAALESHNTPERAPDAGAETVVGAGAGTTGVDGGSDVLASGSQASTSTSAVGRGVGGGASACGKQQQQQPQLNATDVRELREIKQLLWGENVRDDVFKRWSQGFEFSEFESTALVQKQGGPCAVIAPVQAYLLKIIIMDMPSGIKLSEISSDKCQSLLIQALCNILKNCRTPRYRIVHLMRRRGFASADPATKERSPSATSESAAAVAARAAAAAALETGVVPGQGEGGGADIDLATEATPASVRELLLSQQLDSGNSPTQVASHHPDPQRELSPDEFHNRLHTLHFDDYESLARYYTDNYDQLAHTYGVLLFMYSVFLTKGSEQVAAEVSDTSEPLIHSTYGYGAQSLINLMLTGRAVAHVWDNEQDVGGLKLRGICEQSDIGFITLMEQMRYCTVGSFFKNPRFPVWVMGSDTHLTVLFSNEKRLVSPETPSETGRRIFKSYDPEGNNFISSTMLREVLAALNLVSEPAYVSLMQKRLDPENLGIILLNAFMDEFFPLERRSTPDTFELLHYNGIPGSNENNKVRYYCGSAILLEGDLKSICTSNPMVTCLQTKWPNIEINWHDTHMPSLN
ncbi:ubiquitin carboxyl-terminal hydrolase MINDY-3 homolog isoform X1 [Drosophila bipectinata]|uniref:ubiquitin carboxyl-terminal hydrolase MINDY-3 homolog isoform X1 n=1 Tax=Drosophila bipectinata TaxID=42026 RepID=UPI001C8A158C|nr:ubiquitin carboxyl-terminal hydrolase MINDY-3 homolog isoform X1 [Drosophila bipectinata]